MKHARPDYDARIVDLAGLVPDDEPVLFVRGQDLAAPATARAWALENERRAGDPHMTSQVWEHAKVIEAWQEATGRGKLADLPDPDAPPAPVATTVTVFATDLHLLLGFEKRNGAPGAWAAHDRIVAALRAAETPRGTGDAAESLGDQR